MNIYPVPIPNNLFQPLANHWLPANGGRVIISTCEGVDYLYLDGECRLVHSLSHEKKGRNKKDQGNELLFDLINVVQEPAQWQDLASSVPPDRLISWCETYGMLLRDEVMPDGSEGVRLAVAQIEVLTLYLIFSLWQSIMLPPAQTQDLEAQEQQERSRLIGLLFLRCIGPKKPVKSKAGHWEISLDILNPAHLLHAAARELDQKRQCLLLKCFIQDILGQRLNGLTPDLSLIHPRPQFLMRAECPLTVAYWQLANLMLKPDEKRRYHVCPCGRSFYGHATRKYCSQCDRRTAYSRRARSRSSGQGR